MATDGCQTMAVKQKGRKANWSGLKIKQEKDSGIQFFLEKQQRNRMAVKQRMCGQRRVLEM